MNLYKNLSKVYHEIYQNLFDYEKEFSFYSTVLNKFKAQEIIEYGCGTGNLARRFIKLGFDYLGVDLNREMLTIATESLPKDNFVVGDLKTFKTDKKFDGALITGRTLSYLNHNTDILTSFKCIHRNIKDHGILIFDAIDAPTLFSDFDESSKKLSVGKYVRISNSKQNLETGWTWDWCSEYFEKTLNGLAPLGKDRATVRAFTKDEIKLFLTMSGFELLEIIKKETYMWQDHYFIAQKKSTP